MNLDLEPTDGTTGVADDEPAIDRDDHRDDEQIDGVWVPKHRADPLEPNRDGFEEIDGIWVEKPMGNPSGEVGLELAGMIRNFVRAGKLGHILGADGAYRMLPAKPKLLRKPDISFVAAGRLSAEDRAEGEWRIAPDFAVEVISPNDTAEEIETKLDEYLRAGVRLVWVVYLPTRNVWAYRPDGTAKRYRAEDTITGEDVLPGFAVRVGDLFEGL